jgi:type III secretion protein J
MAFIHPRVPPLAWLAALLFLFLGGCKMPLYSNLQEKDANEMLALLLDNGLDADKEPGEKDSWNLLVEKADLAVGMDLLKARALPRTAYDSLGQVFRKDGIISTPLEERARLMYALSQELGGTIAAIDGVLEARVHLVLPEQEKAGDAPSPSSASVFIRHRADVDMRDQVREIKKLVENSVRGLKYESITAVLFPVPLEPPVPRPKTPGPGLAWPALLAAGGLGLALGTGGALFFYRRGRFFRAGSGRPKP